MNGIELAHLTRIVGNSFKLLDDMIVDIYSIFLDMPEPFYLIKIRGKSKFTQIKYSELMTILRMVNMPLYLMAGGQLDYESGPYDSSL